MFKAFIVQGTIFGAVASSRLDKISRKVIDLESRLSALENLEKVPQVKSTKADGLIQEQSVLEAMTKAQAADMKQEASLAQIVDMKQNTELETSAGKEEWARPQQEIFPDEHGKGEYCRCGGEGEYCKRGYTCVYTKRKDHCSYKQSKAQSSKCKFELVHADGEDCRRAGLSSNDYWSTPSGWTAFICIGQGWSNYWTQYEVEKSR